MDLDAYRVQAEAFTAELGEEYHGHFAGLRQDFDVEPIYARHAALFEADSIARLREQADAAAARGEDAARRARMLLDFAVDGHLG
ncbi:MAG TPA: hypothetical protein VFV85_00720, partial [Conexibacter sp.]|nr:hypothetical protein [Conexibacter sp.]